MNRIRLLAMLVVLLGLAVATAQEFDWRRFEGTEIRFVICLLYTSDAADE